MSNRNNIADIYPLSPMQQGMLFHTLYAEEDGLYIEQLVHPLTVKSGFDPDTFREAWQQAVNRHAILRTAFAWERREKPLQVILKSVALPFQTLDWTDSPDPDSQLETFLQQDRTQGFSLSAAPLIRLTLIRTSEEQYQFVLTYHHLLLDAWGARLVFYEVGLLYHALREGVSAELPPIRPYRDYIKWLNSQDQQQAESFWKTYLAGMDEPTPLVIARTKPDKTVTDSYGDAVTTLTVEQTAQLQTLARQQRVTLNTLLQGAWALLLSRYTNENDVIFGVTTSGRSTALQGSSQMVGMCINTLPLRTKIEPNETLLTWLQQLQTQQLEGRTYEYSALNDVQNWSDFPTGTPLFESILVSENVTGDDKLQQWDDSFELGDVRYLFKNNYPFTVATELSDELILRIVYDRSRFEDALVTQMLDHYKAFLLTFLGGLDRPINQIDFLTADEKTRYLNQWTAQNSYAAEETLVGLFEAQVAATPDEIALTDGTQQISYAALNQRANQVANLLQARGVEPETFVGLHVERSQEIVVGILGILKAGAAYVPMDPVYPADRIAYMVDDSEMSIVLTQSDLLTNLPEQITAICFDEDAALISAESSSNPTCPAQPENLAYMIYTSGSTGKPKGVHITHHNVVRLFQSTDDWFNFNPHDVFTFFHSYAFDFSVWEMWGALLHGGRLVIVSRFMSQSPDKFYQLLIDENVTVLNQTPSAFQQLITIDSEHPQQNISTLRSVIFGGEALNLASLRPWFEKYGDQQPRLVNMYGITETTVHVTYREITLADVEADMGSVIGLPILDLDIYLLDEQLQPVPVGVPGEIYVAGDGVGRGYHNRPNLTQDRFTQNPFKADSDMYRSGDLARALPNGDIEYIGRIDHQVKIRGFRIEIGEIESTLNNHIAIRKSAVLPYTTANGDKKLAAYLVYQTDTPPTISDLRRDMGQTLPDYMIPSVFVALDEFPLTPNGKLDRRALPQPDTTQPDLAAQYRAPRTAEEQEIATIWADILGVQQVGIEDSFFDLGGDSIVSIRLLSRLRKAGFDLSLSQLFEARTISNLMPLIGAVDSGISAETAPPFSLITEADHALIPNGVEDAYPLLRLQAGMLFHSKYQPDSTAYRIVLSYHVHTAFDAQAFQTALNALNVAHPIFRTTFDLDQFSQPLQLISEPFKQPFTRVDLQTFAANEQEEQIASDIEQMKQTPFDWTTPLLNFTIHERGVNAFQLTLNIHHAVIDGWSLASLFSELFQRYFQATGALETTIQPAPQASLRDVVAQEQDTVADPKTRQFWLDLMQDYSVTHIPSRPTTTTTPQIERYAAHSLSPTQTAAIEHLAKENRVSIKTLFLAAHLFVLNTLSGQADVLTGIVANNRPNSADGDRILGLCLNTLPFRHTFDTLDSWQKLIRTVADQERATLPHRHFPLAELQFEMGGKQFFNTVFNFTHFHAYGNGEEAGVEIEDSHVFEETNFDFMAQFHINTVTQCAELVIDYDLSQFPQEQIAEIGQHYARTLQAMADGQPLATFDSLSSAEKETLLTTWNATERAYDLTQCTHDLIRAQARRTPHAIAVSAQDATLTYAQLEEQATRLAAYLQGKGVQNETSVGIYVERSAAMVVALLAVFKAGGTYIPLDPNFPADRLSYMVDDSQTELILTQTALLPTVPSNAVPALCLDQISPPPAPNFESTVQASQLAYVIYTSGSTGKPKGVAIPHAALTNFLLTMQEAPGITADDTLLAVTTLSFDIAALELYLPLITGSRVLIATREQAYDATQLMELLPEATMLQATPATWQMLLAADWQGDGQLKMLCGGEPLPHPLAQDLLARGGELWNMYGPTETTIWSTVNQIKQDDALITVGRPIANTQIYILDKQLRPVPIGAKGVLYIGGDGLAQAYLNRPKLTAEKFIPHPFGTGRIYNSGDLARYLPDGTIEVLGRADYQVKIRGYRIELGEIETALDKHPAIRRSVVLAHTAANGSKHLVAYFIAQTETTPSLTTLSESLSETLPSYMVPALFIPLDKLPLTPNGKINRKALPQPDLAQPELDTPYVAPRNAIEATLSLIWEDVLNVESVGVHDSYFALGGDSIRSLRLITRARKEGLSFNLADLFQQKTIANLAPIINRAQASVQTVEKPFALLEETDQKQLPADVVNAYPLTRSQAGMVYHTELEPESAVYHNILSYHVVAPFQEEALVEALQQVTVAHPVLRTSIALTGYSEPIQLVHESAETALSILDICHISADEQDDYILDWIEAEKQSPFNLAQAPLIRLFIHRRSEETYQLSVSFHHAVLDGWSDATLLTEWMQRYFRLLGIIDNPITAAPLHSYQAIVAAEKAALQLAETAQFWQDQVADRTINLLPRLPDSSHAGFGQHHTILSDSDSAALKQLARNNGVQLKTVLLAAHQYMLGFVTGQQDILTGFVTNNRPESADGERILGLCLNTLPFRTTLNTLTSWNGLIQSVAQTEQALLPHRYYPLADIQIAAGGEELFETAFNFIHFHIYDGVTELEAVQVLDAHSISETNFTLLANFYLDAQKINLALDYDPSVLSAEQVTQFSKIYKQILQAMVSATNYAGFVPLDSAEKSRILDKWNATKQDYPLHRCTHDLFSEQAAKTPNAIAVQASDMTLTYAQLDEKSTRLAEYLYQRGVRNEISVGIYMERNAMMLVAILAVFKAGGTYVPLDPHFPANRLDYMVDDSCTDLILTESSLAATTPGSQIPILCLDTITPPPAPNFVPANNASQLAYVIYTSGSTGKPKGVAIPHAALTNFLLSMQDTPGLSADESILAITTLSFDIATLELYLPIISGARVVIATREQATDAHQLMTLLEQCNVTMLQATPATWQMLLTAEWQGDGQLKMLCGGEPLPPVLAQALLARGGELWNMYGPTETTVWSSVQQIQLDDPLITVGKPIANTQMYILDEQLRPVPVGAKGNLYIGGDGLAREYLNRPKLTAEKFIPNPFGTGRIYHTGDLARYLPDGKIEVLGRADYQVKVRGHRIELGEIENALDTHAAVQRSVVIVREDSPGDKKLVAYVVVDAPIDGNDLRKWVERDLPYYMVPNQVVLLDEMPLTPNKKVNRKALPQPGATTEATHHYVAPESDTELALATIWEDLLQRPQIGRTDNFFDLGGHSILATQMTSRIQMQLNVRLPLRTIFQTKTLADLGEQIEMARWLTQSETLPETDLLEEGLL